MIKKSVLLTALAIAGFAVTSLAQTVPNYVPTNGLVGWWPFNGNAIDESINTNDGTVNGATLTADRFGNTNAAYSFDGINDFVSNNTLPSLQVDSMTISLWICPKSISQLGIAMTYGNDNGISSQSNGLSIGIANGVNNPSIPGNGNKLQFLHNGITWRPGNYTFNDTINWKNLIVVRNNNQSKIYVNGNLTATYTDNINNPSIFFRIGSANNIRFFKGRIDDIGIWNRALTQQEITTLYNGNLCFQTITVTDTLLINTNLTGFNPVTYQNTIKIWPNPTNDHITIDNGNLANLMGHQLKISNALGQQVFQSAITQQQFYVDMSTWGGNGIYFVNLINAQGVTIETRKIVLQ